jgi:transcriptional antiterminator RfaH
MWFALQVQPSKEKMVASILASKGYEYFLPLWKPARAAGKAAFALFPGYLFCRFDLQSRQTPIVTTPGFLKIVGVGRTPEPVPDRDIESLRRVTTTESGWTVEHRLYEGCRVAVCTGPFAGVEGIFVRKQGTSRVVVQVALLGGGASVNLEQATVRGLDVPSDGIASVLGPCALASFSAGPWTTE